MHRFDRILVINTSKNIQIKRASSRDDTSAQIIEKIINSQANYSQRVKYADDVIDNDVKIEELNDTVIKLHDKYLKLSNEKQK